LARSWSGTPTRQRSFRSTRERVGDMVSSSYRSRYQIKLGFRGKGSDNLNRAKKGNAGHY
jgi:hypothetical protein